MLLATFTFGDALLTTLEFALLFLWIWIAVDVVFDVFRSRDLSNGAKALWILLIIVVPPIGVLAYLVARGHTMQRHEMTDQARYEAFRRFSQSFTPGGPAGDINALADLRERGILSDEEFERAKSKVLQ